MLKSLPIILLWAAAPLAAPSTYEDEKTFGKACELLMLTSIRQQPGSVFDITDKHRSRTLKGYPQTVVQDRPATVFVSGDSAFCISIKDHWPVYTRAASRQALNEGKGLEAPVFSQADSAFYVPTGKAMPDYAFFYELANLLQTRKYLPYDVPFPRPYVNHRLHWYGKNVLADPYAFLNFHTRYCADDAVKTMSTDVTEGYMDIDCHL